MTKNHPSGIKSLARPRDEQVAELFRRKEFHVYGDTGGLVVRMIGI
jgi:hypothetical protein